MESAGGIALATNNEDDVDLQFVVQGDFFDGEEFNPVIMTDNQEELHIENGSDDGGPEFVNLELRSEQNDGEFAIPIAQDDDQVINNRQTVNTFNYAGENKPSFLKGVPSALPNDRETNLGSAVVSL